MKLPKITNKQQEILKLLYTYRFLTSIQIQTLMNHKDRKTINLWLKDLREKEYVTWIYSTNFLEKTKPAIYYIGTNGVRFLKSTENYPLEEVRKRYRESSRSQTFIDHSILIADCCITLEQKRTDDITYFYETEAEYRDNSYYHFILESELICPDLCFDKSQYDESCHEDIVLNSYLLEIFDATLPRYRLKHRLKCYIEYLESGDWQDETEEDKPPIVLLACPSLTDLVYAKRRTKRLLENIQDEDADADQRLHIRFATIEKLREHGVTGKIWEEA